MRTLNRIVLVGRVGRDPEIRTPSGQAQPWGTFSVATSRNRRNAEGGWTEETDWHWIKVFGKEAEYCQKHLRKGALVSVEGSMVQEKWTGSDGAKKEAYRVFAERVALLAMPHAEAAQPTLNFAESPVAAEAK